jgi:hypothetical protein
MNLAQGIGLYLALWKQVYGKGVEVPFHGTEKGWMSTHSDTNLDLLAKMEIYAALNPEMCGGGRAFNIADGRTVRWAEVWPGLCEDFGPLGVGPTDGGEGIVDFVERNERVWEGLVKREGLRGEPFGEQNWGLVHFMLVDFGFDRELVFPVVNFEILHCKGRFVRCGAAAFPDWKSWPNATSRATTPRSPLVLCATRVHTKELRCIRKSNLAVN